MTEKTDSWQTVFETRDIDVEETEGPEEHPSGWFQTLTRFSKRGFLRVVVSPDDDSMHIHVQFAVPGADEAYAQKLERHLRAISGADWELTASERPWVLEAKVSLEEGLGATIDALSRVATHIDRAEAGEDAAELAEAFDGDADDEPSSAEAADHRDADDETGDDQRRIERQEERRSTPSGGVFETIGDGAGGREDGGQIDGEDRAGVGGEIILDSYRVKVSDNVIIARLEIAGAVGENDQRRLRRALERSLRARFDIKLMLYEPDASDGRLVVELGMELAGLGITDEDSLGSLSHRIGRFFERLKKFNDLGLSLLDVLAGRESSPQQGESKDQQPRSRLSNPSTSNEARTSTGKQKTTRDKPHLRRREDHRRAEGDTSGVVFGFSGGELQADGSAELEAGNYTDPRLRREDATTPLVDVVLRHPGYSDKSMRQVLSILLDIDYYEATKLAKDAPCVIAWGTSLDRAREFKRVIENAGGRVTLVEPDSLQD
ncbi:MAG: hypothetical protein ACLFVJ_07940 [Persicimonas sp.]